MVEEFDEGKTMETRPHRSPFRRMINPKSGTIVWSAQNKRKETIILSFSTSPVGHNNPYKRAVDEMIKTIQ